MAFLCAIDLFNGFMWDSVDIGMAVTTTITTMGTAGEQFLIDIKQTKFAVFIDATEATVLVTHGAVQFVLCIRRLVQGEQTKQKKPEHTHLPDIHHHHPNWRITMIRLRAYRNY